MAIDLLGGKIQLQRKRLGYSQEALAQIVGVSRQAVTKWENGQASPDLEKLIQLSDVLGVSLDHLLKGEEQSAAPLPGPAPSFADNAYGGGQSRELPQFALDRQLSFTPLEIFLALGMVVLTLTGLGGLLAFWVIAVVNPVRLVDWDGTLHTGIWGYVMANELQPVFFLAVGLAVLGCVFLVLIWKRLLPWR